MHAEKIAVFTSQRLPYFPDLFLLLVLIAVTVHVVAVYAGTNFHATPSPFFPAWKVLSNFASLLIGSFCFSPAAKSKKNLARFI